jgi:hypothetical protein
MLLRLLGLLQLSGYFRYGHTTRYADHTTNMLTNCNADTRTICPGAVLTQEHMHSSSSTG